MAKQTLVPVGRLQVATPQSIAMAVTEPTVAQAAVDARVEVAMSNSTVIGAAVDQAITNADIPQQVTDEIAGRDLVTVENLYQYGQNGVPNPRFIGVTFGATGSSARGGGVSVGGSTTNAQALTSSLPPGVPVTRGLQLVVPAANPGITPTVRIGVYGDGEQFRIPVPESAPFSAGLFFFPVADAAISNWAARLRLRCYSETGADLGPYETGLGNQTVAANTWHFLKCENVTGLPAGTKFVAIEPVSSWVGTGPLDIRVRYAAPLTAEKTTLTPSDYGDGNAEDWMWKGTPNQSPSVRIKRSAAEEQALDQLIATGGGQTPGCALTVTGDVVEVEQTVAGKPLRHTLNLTGSLNNGLTIQSITFDGAAVQDPSDDITPLRTQMGTVAANHGFTVASFVNPDGKTAADVGSVWTDGTREYVLLGVLATSPPRVILGGDYQGGGAVPVTSPQPTPTAALTHVSGATKTAPIDHNTRQSRQLNPGTAQRHRHAIFVDGQRVTTDGTFYGRTVEVQESYALVDYASLFDKSKANVGTSILELNADAAVMVQNTWTFEPGGVVLVDNTLTECKPTNLLVCGGIQAQPLQGAVTRYLPGVNTKNGFTWSDGVNLNGYAANELLGVADLRTPGEVATFSMDVLTQGASPVLGFAVGYFPNRRDSDARAAERVTKTPDRLWDMRSTKKVYPAFTENTPAGWGSLHVSAFRVHLAPDQVSAVVADRESAAAAFGTLAAVANLPFN